jgi:hypothetical protein
MGHGVHRAVLVRRGAALGYYGAERDEDRLKMAMVGAAATGVGGVFGALGLGVYLSRQKGR